VSHLLSLTLVGSSAYLDVWHDVCVCVGERVCVRMRCLCAVLRIVFV